MADTERGHPVTAGSGSHCANSPEGLCMDVDVPVDHVLMTALEWRSGHRLPETVLRALVTLQHDAGRPSAGSV